MKEPSTNDDRYRPNTNMRQMWLAPTLIAVITLVGLIAALVGDGWHDAVSWGALGVPVSLITWKWGGNPPLNRSDRS